MRERFLDYQATNDILNETDKELKANVPVQPITRRWLPVNEDEAIGAHQVEMMNEFDLGYEVIEDMEGLNEWLEAITAIAIPYWRSQMNILREDGYLGSPMPTT